MVVKNAIPLENVLLGNAAELEPSGKHVYCKALCIEVSA